MRAVTAAILAGTLLVGSAGSAAAQPPYMEIEVLESGVAPDGRPWFRITFVEAFPPPEDVFSWFLTMFLGVSATEEEFFYLLQRHAGEPSEQLSGPEGPGGDVEDIVLPDGTLLLIFPFQAQPGDPFFIESGELVSEGGERTVFTQGSSDQPLEVGEATADPLELFTSPSPSPSPEETSPSPSPVESPGTTTEGATAAPSPAAGEEGGGGALVWILLAIVGGVVVVVGVVVIRRRGGPGAGDAPGHPGYDDLVHPGGEGYTYPDGPPDLSGS
ncbi:MAG: hypothetical protein HY658_13425 [Actinobacteria bacterium]|nr:hypothetical protein [Actinomycetota bacterium]